MCKRRNEFLCMVLVCCMLVTFIPSVLLKAYAASESQAVAKVGTIEYKNYQLSKK